MTTKERTTEKSHLEERLLALIKARGPISIADYMEDALMHPHDGYYTSQNPIGAKGDFTTAPEISQIFGELIGLWLLQSWADMGEPKAFNLVELGPGRGVLMADILRVANLRPDFLAAAHIWLVEASGRLRHEQQRRLRAADQPVDWADRFSDVPGGPTLVVANELLDCIPVQQFISTGHSWRERLVGLAKDGNSLSFVVGDTPPEPWVPLPDKDETDEGAIFEYSKGAHTLIEEITQALCARTGSALFIDYGHLESGLGDTLQAVKNHKYWPVLSAPGDADITAHVDFERLAKVAFENGGAAFGPVTQGTFLDRLGLAARISRLCENKDAKIREALEAGAFRIAASSEMGEIFKVLCITSPGIPLPAGFDSK